MVQGQPARLFFTMWTSMSFAAFDLLRVLVLISSSFDKSWTLDDPPCQLAGLRVLMHGGSKGLLMFAGLLLCHHM